MSQATKNKDKEMAAYLKAIKAKRTTCNCCICHRLVSLANYENHIRSCRGREKART